MSSAGIGSKELKSVVERIERLEAEKADLAEDMKAVYAEAKATGFDAKIIRQLIRERRMDQAQRAEREELLNLYRSALGTLADTPLGEAALAEERKRLNAAPDRKKAKLEIVASVSHGRMKPAIEEARV